MKILEWFLFLVLLTVASTILVNCDRKPGGDQVLGITMFPKIVQDTLSIDSVSVKSVYLINSTKGRIKIKEIIPECSCTLVDYEPKTLESNDSLLVKLTFKPYVLDPCNKIAYIISDKISSPQFLISNYFVHN